MPSVLLGPDQESVTSIAEWTENYGEPSAEELKLLKVALLLINAPDPE